jgi:hypothetical protein
MPIASIEQKMFCHSSQAVELRQTMRLERPAQHKLVQDRIQLKYTR